MVSGAGLTVSWVVALGAGIAVLVLRQLQDYVIAHELLHFHAPNHGRLWKSLMRVHLGEHEPLESELRHAARKRRVLQQTAPRRH